ncbi:MAG: phage tail tip lysozyme [Roseibium sp.]|uniref:phage tail tip lysozyme n=1 Tax=Roseibium sp. TaxID=1936156 RepID=UPI0032990EC6
MNLRKHILAVALALMTAISLAAPAFAQSTVSGQLMGDLQRDLGLTNAQAAGIVGNLAHETGNFQFMQEISPVVAGSRGGYGFAQWTGPRRVEFESYAASNGLNINSYEANYGYLLNEINSGRHGNIDGVLAAMTPEEAAIAFSNDFLRPGIPHLDARINFANQFADGDFSGSPSGVGGPGGGTFTPTELPDMLLMYWVSRDARGTVPPGSFNTSGAQ